MYSVWVMFSLPPAIPNPAYQILLIVAFFSDGVAALPPTREGVSKLLEIQVHTIKTYRPWNARANPAQPAINTLIMPEEKIPGRQWLHPNEHHRTQQAGQRQFAELGQSCRAQERGTVATYFAHHQKG